MPRRKQTKRTTVKDLRSILRLTYEQGLSVRVINDDSGSKALTADLRASRINVETRHGIVTRVDAVY